MQEKPNRVLIVDGMSVLKTTAGGMAYLTNGFAYNFFTQLTATLKKFPDVKSVIVCWEGGHDFRTKIHAGYKADRKSSSSEIQLQREMVKDLLELVGIDQAYAPGHEADDLGAYLVHTLNVPILLYSNDTDWLQLVDKHVSIYQKSPFSEGKKNLRVEITLAHFDHYTGYPSPADCLKGKCINGDETDKVPGLYGVSEASVKAYLTNGPLPEAKRAKIEDFLESEDFARNMLLVDLRTPRQLDDIRWRVGKPDAEAVEAFIVDKKWNSIAAKFPEWWEVYQRLNP